MATAIVSPYKQSLTFSALGGDQYIQVDYDNAVTINAPYSFRLNDWFTVTQTQQGTEADGTIQRQYRVHMNPSVSARNTTLEFSAVGSDGYTMKKEVKIYQEAPTYTGTTSDIYVYNSPIIIPKERTVKDFSISVGGSQSRDGKMVVAWQNLTTSHSWISDFHYEESGSDDGKTYYYYFSVCVEENTSNRNRVGYCYVDYICEDGEFGTATINITQEPNNGILFDGSNPLVWETGDNNEASPTVTYTGVTTNNTIAQPPTISSGWRIVATYGTNLGSAYAMEYDISPETYNVTDKDKIGTVIFQYTDSRSVHQTRTMYLNQKGCMYPFGIRRSNGDEIPTEGIGINTIKRVRNIPFSANTLNLICFFPYVKTVRYSKLDGTYDWVSMDAGGGYISNNIAGEDYTFSFAESKSTGVRSCKFMVEYECLDGKVYYDEVQLIQDASDGSNLNKSVTCNVSQIKVKADGTPEFSGNEKIRVRYIGNIDYTAPTYPEWIHMDTPVLVEGEGTMNRLYEWSPTYDANVTDEVRTGYINFSADDIDGNTYGVNIDILQAKFVKEPIVNPEIPVEGDEYIGQIWKDVVYDFGDVDIVKYGIYTTYLTTIGNKVTEVDTLVFKGMSCKRPDADSNKIYINKICQNYLNLPLLNLDSVAVGGGYGVFKLKSEDGKTTYKTYRFVNDWSYTNDFKTGLLSHPILNDNSNVVRGQLLPFTVFGAAENVEIPYGIKYYDDITDDYGDKIDDWDNVVMLKNGIETEIFPYSGRTDGAKTYYIGDKTYNVVDDCSVEYVVYYVNPWGGYDWFPIRGKVTEKDTFTQYSIRQNYNNNTLEFGKKRYCNEITKKITLNTQWLREEESLRMWYLLQSNVVYLHNINKNEIYPVVITATETEYKKRTKQSSRISYQIECEFSQSRTRF